MFRIALRNLLGLLAFAVALNSPVVAQNAGNMINLFGGLMRGALIEGARAEWRKVRPAELACIEQQLLSQGISTAALAQQGVFPNDGRVAGIRANCARATVVAASPAAPAIPSQPVITTNPLPLSATPTFDCTKARSAVGRILCVDEAGAKVAPPELTVGHDVDPTCLLDRDRTIDRAIFDGLELRAAYLAGFVCFARSF